MQYAKVLSARLQVPIRRCSLLISPIGPLQGPQKKSSKACACSFRCSTPSALRGLVHVRVLLNVIDIALVQQLLGELGLPGIRGRQGGMSRGALQILLDNLQEQVVQVIGEIPPDRAEATQNAGEISPKVWDTRSTAEPTLC